MTVESQIQQILANQATIIGNQGTILKAIQAIPGGASDAAALAQIETQVADIQAQLETPAEAPPPPPPTPEAAPEAPPAAG